MDRRMAEALDRYITGNYGEDQYNHDDENIPHKCRKCGKQLTLKNRVYTGGQDYICKECFMVKRKGK